jgi:predicted unusual protein kinase regulating ubiquinone biosynthesis (AarF/ABC1/UbiB family)
MLEVQKNEMQEAMLAMNTRLLQLGNSMERSFMENSIQALERRTGKRRAPSDVFSITSLDVIIHLDEKLGSGGYGQVYVGDWHGTRVAVKVLEKGLAPTVRKI